VADFTARQIAIMTVAAGALAGAVVAGAVTAAGGSGNSGASASAGSSQVATVPVVRTDLSTTVQVGGSIGFDGSYTITALGGGGGVYTSLPQPGQIIRQDQSLYSVSNQPVPLLYGSVPAYRAFSAGVFFEPGPIQVTSVSASPGSPAAGPGSTVLTATGLTPVVTADLAVSEEYLVKPGDAVTVVLPDGTTTVGGRIETVGTVATCPGGSGTGAGAGGSSPCEAGGSGNSSAPTVTVTIALDGTPSGAAYDQAPVNVNITTQTAVNVLAVPVNALLALQGGGYGVDVATGGTSHLVGVTTGLYSDTLVQVSGSGITAGMQVEVPAS